VCVICSPSLAFSTQKSESRTRGEGQSSEGSMTIILRIPRRVRLMAGRKACRRRRSNRIAARRVRPPQRRNQAGSNSRSRYSDWGERAFRTTVSECVVYLFLVQREVLHTVCFFSSGFFLLSTIPISFPLIRQIFPPITPPPLPPLFRRSQFVLYLFFVKREVLYTVSISSFHFFFFFHLS